jgi:hypothetical protein
LDRGTSDTLPAKPLPRSTEVYRETLANLPDMLQSTLAYPLDPIILDRFLSAKRIIFTGCGSSWPVAFTAAELFSQNGYPACAEYTSQILQKRVFTASDVFVLVSQGWNRSDACRVTNKILSSSASLVVVTGRSEHSEEHLYSVREREAEQRLFLMQIEPKIEKLFCRPVSPITSFAHLGRVLEGLTDDRNIVSSMCDTIGRMSRNYVPIPYLKKIPDKLVFLGSGGLYGAAQGLALMMREGAGIDSEAHECEAYGHGFYVPHQYQCQKVPGSIKFVILSNSENAEGPARILPLLRDTKSDYQEWTSSENTFVAFVQHVITGSKLVLNLNERTCFDMNTPPGLEENRTFHEEGGLSLR